METNSKGRRRARWFAGATGSAIVLGCALVACSDGNGGSGGGGDDGTGAYGGGQYGSIPVELVGSWYAGAGYTTAPYDPGTGSWGKPSGKGLVYVFEGSGTYTKAYQSYESSGGCTVGFTAFETGSLSASGTTLVTSPGSGHMVYEATCSPELNSDTPLDGLVDETFSWALVPSESDPSVMVLWLQRTDGAESTFTPL
jgi:hypothetical protein